MNVVLITIAPLFNSNGGAQKVFCEMASELSKRGCNVKGIYCDCNETLNNNSRLIWDINSNVKLINVNSKSVTLRKYTVWQKIKTFNIDKIKRKKNRIDQDALKFLDMLNGHVDKADVIISFQPEICYYLNKGKIKIPCITMLHGDPKEMNILNILRGNLSGLIHVLLPAYKKEVEKVTGCPVIVMPNAVPKFETNVDYSNKKVIHIGRFCREKRQDLVVKAFIKAHETYKDWKLELWGGAYDIKYYDNIKKIIEDTSCGGFIKVCGVTSDIENVLNKASIFCFPSETEGFPLAMTEAMSMGLAVIGNRECRGISELIHDKKDGILCDNNIQSISRSMCQLMESEITRRNIGMMAKAKMEDYKKEIVYDKWIDLIQSEINRTED